MYVVMPATDIPQDPRERREWILYRLRVAGYTLSSLARELGVARRTPQVALHRPYPRMERILAETIGHAPHELWPERYDANGKPNRPLGRPRGQPAKCNRHACKINTASAQANSNQRRAS